jgi:hypothetical protein
MTDADIIEALGNTFEVARRLGRKPTAVSNWKANGIPWRWRPQVALMARDANIMIPADFLLPL